MAKSYAEKTRDDWQRSKEKAASKELFERSVGAISRSPLSGSKETLRETRAGTRTVTKIAVNRKGRGIKEAAAKIVENRAQSAKHSAQQKNAQSVKETVRKDTVNKLRDAFGQKAMDKSNLKRVKRTK